MRKLTRREFLRHTVGAAAGYQLARPLVRAAPRAWAESLPEVVVAKGSDRDSAADMLKTALDGLGGIGRFVKPGQTVAIKPNATWAYPPGTASSTDPDLLRALVLMVREAGAKRVIILDRCTLWTTAESLQASGIGQLVDDLRVDRLFPDGAVAPDNLCTAVDFPNAVFVDFRKILMLSAAVEADVRINMAVAKSHLVTKYTMCLKHMMGFMQIPSQLHVQLEQGIADLNTASKIQAHLHILEAIRVRLRGQAGGNDNEITNPGLVKRPNQVLAGVDPVLIDSYGLINFFGRKPKELEHVLRAAEAGLGEIDVEKAAASGRIRTYVVGQATPTPTTTSTSAPTATPMIAAAATIMATPTAPGPTPTYTAVPTNTPLPTPEAPAPTAICLPGADSSKAAASRAGVVDPNPFLSGALIPATAVVLGTGVVIRRRLARHERAEPAAVEEQENAGDRS